MEIFEKSLLNDVEGMAYLPLLHNCSGYNFKKILESKSLKATSCQVFKEDLLYAYYGKPSYRLSSKIVTSDFMKYMVCFIIDGEKVSGIDKIYPFDSGAFMQMPDFRAAYFDNKVQIDDFKLSPELRSAKKVVRSYYGINKNYLEDQPELCIEIDDHISNAGYYNRLINDTTDSSFDGRKSTIELIFNTDLALNKEAIRQVIIPRVFLDDKEIREGLASQMGIDAPLTYEVRRGNPNEFFGAILNLYLNFLNTEA